MLIELLFASSGLVNVGNVRTDDCEVSGLAERDAQFHEVQPARQSRYPWCGRCCMRQLRGATDES